MKLLHPLQKIALVILIWFATQVVILSMAENANGLHAAQKAQSQGITIAQAEEQMCDVSDITTADAILGGILFPVTALRIVDVEPCWLH